MSNFSVRIATPLRWVGALLAAALLAGCERPPVETIQNGYRGTGREHVFNQRVVNQDVAKNTAPASLPAAPADGISRPLASAALAPGQSITPPAVAAAAKTRPTAAPRMNSLRFSIGVFSILHGSVTDPFRLVI